MTHTSLATPHTATSYTPTDEHTFEHHDSLPYVQRRLQWRPCSLRCHGSGRRSSSTPLGSTAVGGDGGGLCSYQIVNLLAGGRTNVTGNTARRHGGAMALHDNDLLVHAGHRLLASGNVASTHGGALALLSGAKLDFLVDEVCQTNWCSDTDRGDGICSLGCLTSACNWDNGDCVQHRFDRAGIQASKPHCSLLNQTTAATARGSAEVLELYPGCGDVPMRLDQNTAGNWNEWRVPMCKSRQE